MKEIQVVLGNLHQNTAHRVRYQQISPDPDELEIVKDLYLGKAILERLGVEAPDTVWVTIRLKEAGD